MPDGDFKLSEFKMENLTRLVVQIQEAAKAIYQYSSQGPAKNQTTLPTPQDHYGPAPLFHLDDRFQCGLLQNKSLVGCNYFSPDGKPTLMGLDLKSLPQGVGVSLTFYLGGD